ncbi:pantetheine-phosphate adenylyltransferase [Granulicoccus phenolivorans]|uniref:pantetheine-phosphate adenylyltransferase n=1 Tax=Granulicoccus phenolivorans TaxID=266854 RepID=UPI00041A142E|nr:pantetheine-phosphate adenylyltransferase [Granulicoccus phenolivorans]
MKALCPGSFDPVTMGHLDIIKRSSRLFETVLVGVASNTSKNALFGPDERVEMLRESVADLPNVEVRLISGLLAEFAAKENIGAVVKGLRFASDFDYELQMAQMNHRLNADLETILLPTAAKWAFVSSTLVREIAILGGDISAFVPPLVVERTRQRVAERRAGR